MTSHHCSEVDSEKEGLPLDFALAFNEFSRQDMFRLI